MQQLQANPTEPRANDTLHKGGTMTAVMDYPTAWAFVKATNPGDHDVKCSWRTTNGALLCDCDVIWDEYVRRGGTDPRVGSGASDSGEARDDAGGNTMIEISPADTAMVEAFREAAYEIDHQRDDAPDHRAANQIIGEAFERRGLIVARREEVDALRAGAAADV